MSLRSRIAKTLVVSVLALALPNCAHRKPVPNNLVIAFDSLEIKPVKGKGKIYSYSQLEGESQVQEYIRESEYSCVEDAWLFKPEINKWYDVGKNESRYRVEVSFPFFWLFKRDPGVDYHNHCSVGIAPPSFTDLYSAAVLTNRRDNIIFKVISGIGIWTYGISRDLDFWLNLGKGFNEEETKKKINKEEEKFYDRIWDELEDASFEEKVNIFIKHFKEIGVELSFEERPIPVVQN